MRPIFICEFVMAIEDVVALNDSMEFLIIKEGSTSIGWKGGD